LQEPRRGNSTGIISGRRLLLDGAAHGHCSCINPN
jgi:hypothetical protein